MRTPPEIYETYRIPAIVQRHQLRVAAVGKILADRTPAVDVHKVVLTGLFHDMGNILKMDLSSNASLLPLLAPDTAEELIEIQDDFRKKYGADEHVAAVAICTEIGVPSEIITMIDNMRFSRTEWVLEEAPMEMKIIKYADLRAAPQAIVPMRERLDEARRRYRGKKFDTGDREGGAELLQKTEAQCLTLERLVCEKAMIDPLTITEESTALVVERLRHYES